MVTLPPELETLGEGALRTIREAFIKFDVTNEGYISRSGMQFLSIELYILDVLYRHYMMEIDSMR